MLDEEYIQRCFDLAQKSGRQTGKNPLVGAVLVHNDRIIGEGFHKKYGSHHAEVNAVASVSPHDVVFISESTLYVSLEPCCIHGNTPPCTDLILRHQIKKVVISVLDPNPKIAGKGVSLLRSNGVDVKVGILKEKGEELIKKFRENLRGLPFITLKMVTSADGYMGSKREQVWLSNPLSSMASHTWRSQVDGILIGTHTALIDDPSLTTRLVPGENPVRIVFDNDLILPSGLKIFNEEAKTIVISRKASYPEQRHATILQYESDHTLIDILKSLYAIGIYSLLVEGGSKTLRRFVTENLWNEAILIHTEKTLHHLPKEDLIAGVNFGGQFASSYKLRNNALQILKNPINVKVQLKQL